MILIFFKIVVVFNTISADFVLMSADVVLKTTTILKEMRISQLSSLNEHTLTRKFILGIPGTRYSHVSFIIQKNPICHQSVIVKGKLFSEDIMLLEKSLYFCSPYVLTNV